MTKSPTPSSDDVAGAEIPSHSFEAIERSRLIPRISFRMMFFVTFLGAVFFAVARAADEGASFAIGLMAAMLFLVVMFALQSLMFIIAWAFALGWKRPDPDLLEGSPFADGQLPPQWLPPTEPPK